MGRPSNAEIAARSEKQEVRARIDAREYAAKVRRERVGITSITKRLPDFGDNPGWKRRWVNEENLPQRKHEGYRFVTKDEVNDPSYDASRGNSDPSNYLCRAVGGVTDQGNLRQAYLMEIPDEIASELDFEKSIKQVKVSESQIRNGTVGNPQAAGNMRGQEDGVTPIKISTK